MLTRDRKYTDMHWGSKRGA